MPISREKALQFLLEDTKDDLSNAIARINNFLSDYPVPTDQPSPPQPEPPPMGIIPSLELSTSHPDYVPYSDVIRNKIKTSVFGFQDWDIRPTMILNWWDLDGRREEQAKLYCAAWFNQSVSMALVEWNRGQDLTEFSDDQYLSASLLVRDWCYVLNWCPEYIVPGMKTAAEKILSRVIENMRSKFDPKLGYVPTFWGDDNHPALNHFNGWVGKDGGDNPGNNYFYAHLEAVVYWALHSQDPKWITHLRECMFPLLTDYFSLMQGGGSMEGTGYGKSQMNLFRVVWLWRKAMGDAPQLRCQENIEYWVNATTPDFKSNAIIGDQAMQSYPTLANSTASGDYLRSTILWAARLAGGSPQATDWLAKDTHYHHWLNHWHLCANAPFTTQPPSPGTVNNYYSAATGTLFSRDPATGAYLTFFSGDNTEAHMGECQGELCFYHPNSGWLLSNSSTWSKSGIRQTSDNHCVPQLGDKQSKTSQCTFNYTDQSGLLTISASLSAAYPESVIRNVVWDRELGTLQVQDTKGNLRFFTGTKPIINGQTSITLGPLTLPFTPFVVDMADIDPEDFDREKCYRIDYAGPRKTVFSYKATPIPNPPPTPNQDPEPQPQEPHRMLAPLDTIHSVWRAQPPINGAIPNDGTSGIPLVLGSTTNPETSDPTYQPSPDRLEIRTATATDDGDFAQAAIPLDVLNGDFSIFIRFIPRNNASLSAGMYYTHQPLWYMIDNPLDPNNPQKKMFSYLNTGAKSTFRIFNTSGSTTDLNGSGSAATLNQPITYGFSYESATRTLRSYRNGVPDGSVVMPASPARSPVTVALLRLCSPTLFGSSTRPYYDFIVGGFDNRVWTDSEFAASPAAIDDYVANGGSAPPPPPPPPPPVVGSNKFKLNGVDTAITSIKRNGVEQITAVTGPDDVLWEINN